MLQSIFNTQKQKKNTPVGTFGFDSFDSKFGALHQGQLVVVGGAIGIGKTRYLTELAVSNLHKGVKTLYLLIGQSYPRVSTLISNAFLGRKSYDTSDFNNVDLKILEELQSLLIFDELPYANFSQLSDEIIPLMKKNKIDLIIIDGIQVLRHTSSIRQNDQLRLIQQELRLWTMEYNVPIIVSSQLGKQVSYHSGERLLLSDLRGSSDLGELADTVIILNRPEYYGITEDHMGNSLINITKLIVLKNRQGMCGDFTLFFDKNNHSLKEQNDNDDFNISVFEDLMQKSALEKDNPNK